MTKNIVIGLFILLSLNTCGVRQKKVNNEIKLNLNVSDEFIIEQKAVQDIKMTIGSNEIKSKNVINSSIKLNVLKKNGKDYIIDFQYLDLSMKIVSNQINYEFSTKKEINPNDKFGIILKKIIGLSFQATINEKGTISECTGIEIMLDSLVNSFESSEAKKAQIKNQLLGYYGSQTIKSMLEPFINIYPEKSVKINDSWSTEYESKNPIPTIFNNKFSLTEINDQEIIINGNSDITTKKEKVFAKDKTYLLSGHQDILLKLDPKSKFIRRGDYKSTIKGEVIFESDNQSQKIPMEISAEMSYTLKKISKI